MSTSEYILLAILTMQLVLVLILWTINTQLAAQRMDTSYTRLEMERLSAQLRYGRKS